MGNSFLGNYFKKKSRFTIASSLVILAMMMTNLLIVRRAIAFDEERNSYTSSFSPILSSTNLLSTENPLTAEHLYKKNARYPAKSNFSLEPVNIFLIPKNGIPHIFLSRHSFSYDAIKEIKIDTPRFSRLEWNMVQESKTQDSAKFLMPQVIEISFVYEETFLAKETIPFEEKIIKTKALEKGVEILAQEGVPGVLGIHMKRTLKNGVVLETKELEQRIIKKPVDKIIKSGTKITPKYAEVDGQTIAYCDVINMRATSYDKNCKGCNGYTSTGAELRKGVIAADPKRIPYGTRLYVPGYGYGVIADTGGYLMKSEEPMIDLGFYDFEEDNAQWHTHYVDVYFMCPEEEPADE